MKHLEKILFWGLGLTLITPLMIGESMIFPFITTKAYFFLILIDVLFIVYLLVLTQKSLYPKKNKLLFFFIAITLLGFIFDIFGASFQNSFWGNYERMVSIFTSIHFLVYLWMLLSVCDTQEKYTKFLNIGLIVSFIIGIYGILQKMKVDFFGMVNIEDWRISATFGNPAYLAGFALLWLFLAGYLFSVNKNKNWRVFYITSIILNLVIIYFTGTRGAIVGLVMGVVASLVYLLILYKNKKVRLLGAGFLVLLSLLGSSIFIFRQSSLIQNNPILVRISEIGTGDYTSMSRLMLWQMAFKGIQDRPVFGYGQNNIKLPLDKYHNYNLAEDWFDSSHNKFFDELLAHGFIGFGLQIIFFIWLLWVIIQKRKEDKLGSLLFFGMIVAYIAQAMFIFDAFTTVFIFMFILGFIFIYTQNLDQVQVFKRKLPFYLVFVLGIILFWIFAFVYSNSIGPARKMVTGYRTIISDLDKTTGLYEEIEQKMFFSYDIFASYLGQQTLTIFNNKDKYTDVQLRRYIDLIGRVYKRAISDSANFSQYYINLAKLYQSAYQANSRINYLDQSIELLNQALQYSPNRIDIYYALAQGHYLKGDISASQNILNKALSLNIRQGDVYIRLADVESRKGDPVQAIIILKKAKEFGGKINMENLETFAQVFINRQAWDQAIEVFLMIDQMQPNNIDTYHNIALAYSYAGNKDKAIEWMTKILEINPGYQEVVDAFITELK